MTSPTSITGYKADAAYWCPPCARENYGSENGGPENYEPENHGSENGGPGGNTPLPPDTLDHEKNEVFPVFAGEELDFVPTCNACGETLEGHRLTQDGVTALARSMTKRRNAAGVSIMDFAQALRSEQTGKQTGEQTGKQGAGLTLEEALRELVRNPETLDMLHHWITATRGGKLHIVGGLLFPFGDYAAHAAARKHDPGHRCAVCAMEDQQDRQDRQDRQGRQDAG